MLVIGWARLEAPPPAADDAAPADPQAVVQQRVRLGLVTCGTVLSIVLLVAGSSSLIGLALVGVLAFLMYPMRDYLNDVWAGLYLNTKTIENVTFDEQEVAVKQIGLIEATLVRENEEEFRVRNRKVMAAVVGPAE